MGLPVVALSALVAAESKAVFGTPYSSNAFRHALHTHSQGKIPTSEMAVACQHTESTAKSNYVHTNTANTAFVKFYNAVLPNTSLRESENIEIEVNVPDAEEVCSILYKTVINRIIKQYI